MRRLTHKRALVFASLAALHVAAWTTEAQAQCFSLPVSTTGCTGTPDGSCQGTSGKDVIKCTNPQGCVMDGGAANDLLRGSGGPDVICGRDGNDALVGRAGTDHLDGGAGVDLAIGDSGFFENTDYLEVCNAELVFTCQDTPEPVRFGRGPEIFQ